jgi:hypothetical protein
MRDDGWKRAVEHARDHGRRVVFRELGCSSELGQV